MRGRDRSWGGRKAKRERKEEVGGNKGKDKCSGVEGMSFTAPDPFL